MARRLTLAEKEHIQRESYELSLQGYSARSIAKKLGTNHKTVLNCLQREATRRAQERPDRRQFALDSLRRAMKRAWEELDKNPSPHACAQLLHALNSLQAEMNKIDGVYSPERIDIQVSVRQEVSNLADGPLEAVSIILEAAARGEDGQQALREVVASYESGTLAESIHVSSPDLLELASPDEFARIENLDELRGEAISEEEA